MSNNETQQTSDTELLPCPFCGGEAVYEEVEARVTSSGKIMWSVGCNSCGDDDEPTCFGYQSPIVFNRKCEAAKTWNTRSELK
jgi:C4-type Zn-finger protein